MASMDRQTMTINANSQHSSDSHTHKRAETSPLRRPANTSPPTSDPGADNGRSGLDRPCQEGLRCPALRLRQSVPPSIYKHLPASPLEEEGCKTLANSRALAEMQPWHLEPPGLEHTGTARAHCCAQPLASDSYYAATGLIATRVHDVSRWGSCSRALT